MSRHLYRMGRFAALRPWRVIGVWFLLSVAVIGASSSFGRPLDESVAVPGLDSQEAIDLLSSASSDEAGLTAYVVATPLDGSATFFDSAAARAELASLWFRDELAAIELDLAAGGKLERHFALLGNAGEFLDPIFSSGVTIAMKSASLAAACLGRVWDGEVVDWQKDYAQPLKAGVDTFRVFVESWYAGGFQKVIFHEHATPEIRRMISSILAGYAWDRNNPYVAEPARRLKVLEELCSA